MMFQIQESCKERKCGCKDHENQKTRRGNRRKWLLEKQFNPNFVYNGIVHFYMDKKGYQTEFPKSIDYFDGISREHNKNFWKKYTISADEVV